MSCLKPTAAFSFLGPHSFITAFKPLTDLIAVVMEILLVMCKVVVCPYWHIGMLHNNLNFLFFLLSCLKNRYVENSLRNSV